MSNQIVITLDIATGNLVSVTDENGVAANEIAGTVRGDEFGEVEKPISATILKTKKNPQCIWIYINGTWYYICV